MTTTFQAVFVHGVLRPLERLDLAENQVVRLHIEADPTPSAGATGPFTLKGLWSLTAAEPLTRALEDVRRAAEGKIDYLADSLSTPEP
jgi:hypothetical protein